MKNENPQQHPGGEFAAMPGSACLAPVTQPAKQLTKMNLEQEDFAVNLAATSKTHEEWLSIVRFGRGTLLEDQGILAEIIVAEAVREAEKHPHHKPSDEVAKILRELGLRLANYSGASLARKPAARSGVGGDSFVEMRCGWLREPLKSILLHHLAETSEDEATARLLTWGNVELEVMDEQPDHSYWHCSVTKKRGIPWVLGNGNGSTLRGALISTLTNFEAAEIEAGGGGAEHGERKRRTKSRAKPLNGALNGEGKEQP